MESKVFFFSVEIRRPLFIGKCISKQFLELKLKFESNPSVHCAAGDERAAAGPVRRAGEKRIHDWAHGLSQSQQKPAVQCTVWRSRILR
jgi:hypothetical protein